MDLNRLKIDRGERTERTAVRPRGPRGGRGSLRLGRIGVALLAAGAIWLFRGQLLQVVDRFRLPEVETALVARRSVAATAAAAGTAANGFVVARIKAALSADTPGRIVELNVVEGQKIPKGFAVARLYADEYAAELRRAEADLLAANAAAARAAADEVVLQAEIERWRLDTAAAEASIAEAVANERLAELELKRVQDLVADDNESQRRLDEAEAELKSASARRTSLGATAAALGAAIRQAEARLAVLGAATRETCARVDAARADRDRAQATLDKSIIRAPFDGVVVLKDAEIGEVVSPNVQAGGNARGSVATMVDFESLEVQAEVPETSLAAVQIGGPATIFLDAFPDQRYRGVVERIWPTANRQKATVEVRAKFLEKDDRLRPEMGVRIVFGDPNAAAHAASEPAVEGGLYVPEDAVVAVGGAPKVFVLERDVARLRSVATGGRATGKVTIESGLAEGEIVVRKPPPSLADGDRVRAKEQR